MSLKTDVEQMVKWGMITDPNFWLTNAVSGKIVKGEIAAQLIKNVVLRINSKSIINA
jgi:uncharacterized protein YuzB (UPF0349 family)